MVELSGDEKTFRIIKATITTETVEVMADTKEEAERIVLSGETIGRAVFPKGRITNTSIIETTEV